MDGRNECERYRGKTVFLKLLIWENVKTIADLLRIYVSKGILFSARFELINKFIIDIELLLLTARDGNFIFVVA